MKTYTRDEIKRIMIDRPGVVFVLVGTTLEFYYSHSGVLHSRRKESKEWGFDFCLGGQTYTIPADNEKPAELPESVRAAVKGCHLGGTLEVLVEALWAETVKLVEAGKK